MLAILLCFCLWQQPASKQNPVSGPLQKNGGQKQQAFPENLPVQRGIPSGPREDQSHQNENYTDPGWYTMWTTIAYTLVSLGTLIVISRQNSSIKKQIGIQEESLRPRLSISGFSSMAGSGGTPWMQATGGRFITFHAEFYNSGGIPAYKVIPETWLEFSGVPFRFSADALYYRGDELTIPPGRPGLRYMIPFNRSLTLEEIQACQQAKGTVCIRIKLTYPVWGKDVFTEEAYSMEPTSMKTIIGSAKAN
ncbi:MAG TPA: hypothetical protein VGL22_17530 [Terracidiphilus sp.]